MLCGTTKQSTRQGRGQHFALCPRTLQEVLQSCSIESPIEGARLSIAQLLMQRFCWPQAPMAFRLQILPRK
jgi:hypothetical protein